MKTNHPTEQRFPVSAAAIVAPFEQPGREFAARFLDVSGAGIGLLTAAELVPGQTLTIETDMHLILATVRHSRSVGAKFELGAVRAATVVKFDLPAGITKQERNRILAGVSSHIEPGAIQISLPIAMPEIFPADSVASPFEPPEAIAFAQVPPAIPAMKSPIAVSLPTQPRIAAQLMEVRRSSPWQSRALAVLMASGLSAAMAFEFGGFRNHSLPVVRAANTNQTAAKPKAAERATPKPAAAPVPSVSANKSVASIRTSDRSWITACADGKLLFSKLFVEGSAESVEFTDRATVRMGNSGPVEISVDGKPAGPVGRMGEVRAVEITSSGVQRLPDAGTCGKAL